MRLDSDVVETGAGLRHLGDPGELNDPKEPFVFSSVVSPGPPLWWSDDEEESL